MNILIVYPGIIPVFNYGGTERVLWSLGKELHAMGHKITYLVSSGSTCPFARVIYLDPAKSLTELIPNDIDFIHFNFIPNVKINKPYIVNWHGNLDTEGREANVIFVSGNHAARFGSDSFIHNGLDWSEYAKPDFTVERNYFHFLANAAWRLKNVKGAIKITKKAHERLAVLGGSRLNIKMGFRFTLDRHVSFHGMVGGKKKYDLMNGSKGLIFPVRWHEPFGLALTESLYYGCPVFGTPYGSLPEIVTKDVGFLSANSDELAYAAKHVDDFDRKKCSEYAIENFNSKKMAREYLEKYEKVLNGEKLNKVNPTLQKIQQEKFLPFE